MTTSIDNLVLNINIGLDASPVQTAGFSVVAHAGPSTFAEAFRLYSSAQAAASDSSTLTSGQLASIQNIFGANNPPQSTMAAKVSFTFTAQVSTVTINASDDGNYTVTINGTEYAFAASSQTTTQIATGLAAAANANAAVTVTSLAAVITITADTAGTGFTVAAGVPTGSTPSTVATTTANASPSTSLDTLVAAGASFYGLVIDSRDAAVILNVAAWAEANSKLFIAQSNDANIRDAAVTTDVLSQLRALSYGRTALTSYNVVSNSVRQDGAWASTLSANPDTTTTLWAHKTLPGVAIDASLTDTTIATVLSKNGNVYSQLLGVGAMWRGRTVDGRAIDLRITADWTETRIRERLAQAFLDASNRNSKIPYTDQGLTMLGGVIRGVLLQGEEAGHFVPNRSTVGVPRLVSVPRADRVARVARFSFTAEPAGAIEGSMVSGTISIPL